MERIVQICVQTWYIVNFEATSTVSCNADRGRVVNGTGMLRCFDRTLVQPNFACCLSFEGAGKSTESTRPSARISLRGTLKVQVS